MVRTYLSPQVSILDVRPADAFNQGHVPFALNIPADVFRGHLGNPQKLAEALGAAGVDPSLEAVVVSGAGLTPDSALAFLMLEKVGQKKTSVFMDSMDGWAKQGFTVAKNPTAVGPRKAPGDLTIEPKTYPLNVRNGLVISDPASSQGPYPKVFIASGRNLPASPDGKTVQCRPDLNPDGTPRPRRNLEHPDEGRRTEVRGACVFLGRSR
jgi:rhodanese-related sulfurtransferase